MSFLNRYCELLRKVSEPGGNPVNRDRPSMVDNFRTAGLELLAPLRCALCGAACPAEALCAACRDELPWNRRACPRCALPQTHAGPCAHCLRRPPPFAAAWAPLRLESPIREQIHALKYGVALHHAPLLAALFAQSLRERGAALPDLVLPVPLHRGRLWRRGYNQSAELLRALARDTGLAIDLRGAARRRATADQIGMNAAQRRRNVRGAFTVKVPVRGLRVALLDDVMTTGATLAELARAALAAGASEVEVWAIARVP